MTEPVKKPKKVRVSEHAEQAAVFAWAELMARRDPRLLLLNSSQNGMRSSIRQAVAAKEAGMKKGVPDIFLPIPAGTKSGLFIEMKRKDGRLSDLSDEQRWWLAALHDQGYQTAVCFGAEQAVETIKAYMAGGGK